MMARHKAGVSRCLARTLEALWRSELAYDDRSGLKTDARDRVQQRASILQLRILLDVLFDFFLQVLKFGNLDCLARFRRGDHGAHGEPPHPQTHPADFAFWFSLSGGPVGPA